MRFKSTFVVLAVALAAAIGFAPSAQAVFPGQNGKILIQDDGYLWTVEPDGSGLAQVTPDRSYFGPRGAVWSPDGSRIVLESGLAVAADFTIIDSDGTEVGRIQVPGNGTDPSWSPDNEHVAYHSIDSGCDPYPVCYFIDYGVRVIGVDGTGDREVVSEGRNPAWSPDGARIAYSDELNDLYSFEDIWIVNPDGTGATDVTRNGGEPNQNPDWSPDGKALVYISVVGPCCSPNGELFTIHADGTNGRRLTTSADHEQRAVWSPDGTKIAFSAGNPDLSGPAGVFVMNVDGTGLTKIAERGLVMDWQAIPNAPPDCSEVTADPASLWPANKQLRTVTLTGASDADGDAVTLYVTGVTHDEGGAQGWQPGSAPNQVLLRAERDPKGDGRVYAIAVEATDEHGAKCTGEATVTVPRHK